MSTKWALVTGSAGFVGRHMVRRLTELGYEVVGWDLANEGGGVDAEKGFNTHSTFRYDLVVHCAYHVGGRKAIDGSLDNLAKNVALDAALFRFAERTRPGWVLYFSSSAAYPVRLQMKESAIALREDFVGGWSGEEFETPDADYGWAKLTGERMARNYARAGGNVTVVRPFSGYGSDQALDYPFPTFVFRAKQKLDPFPVWGDPTSVRDWIHIDDVVGASLALCDAGVPFPVNICTGVGTNMEQLARLCMRAAGYNAEIVSIPGPQGVHTRVGTTTELRKYYTPRITIEEGVRMAFSEAKT